MKLYVLPLLLLLSGCGASMVSTRGDSTSQYAPTNEKDARGGTVKYLNQGIPSVKRNRRESAYRQMYEYCNGPYRVIREGQVSEGGAFFPVGGMAVYDEGRYWHMDFECEK